jgi:hypothetical protein
LDGWEGVAIFISMTRVLLVLGKSMPDFDFDEANLRFRPSGGGAVTKQD